MDIPLLQTKKWQKLAQDLGETTFFEETPNYQYLAILKNTPVGNYLYLPYGPVAKDRAAFQKSLKSLENLAKKTHAIFTRIEPQNPDFIKYLPKNTQKSKDLNPKETWILDLKPKTDEIYKNMKQNTRNLAKNYAKKGLKIRKTTDPDQIKHLVFLQQKLAKERHINVFSEHYLKTELEQPFAALYLVEYSPNANTIDISKSAPKSTSAKGALAPAPDLPKPGQIIAASLFFDHDKTRYYMQSASDNKFKKLPATIALLAEAIFDAKKKGITKFDFWGIAPDDAPADHPWKGFTRFKKSFGGYPVEYAGTYDVILKPAKYHLYQLTRALNRLIRRVK